MFGFMYKSFLIAGILLLAPRNSNGFSPDPLESIGHLSLNSGYVFYKSHRMFNPAMLTHQGIERSTLNLSLNGIRIAGVIERISPAKRRMALFRGGRQLRSMRL
jgi:hypothetical protein